MDAAEVVEREVEVDAGLVVRALFRECKRGAGNPFKVLPGGSIEALDDGGGDEVPIGGAEDCSFGELGHGAGAHIGAFALNPPPSVDKIREAIARLKDPEKRLIDEFFWFWPDRFGESAKDPALQAVDQGDQNTAYQLWIEREPDPETGFVANPSSILDLLLYARSITIF